MFTQAVQGGPTVDLPDDPKDPGAGLIGSTVAGAVSTVRNVLTPYVDALESGGNPDVYNTDRIAQQVTGTDAFTFHGWDPSKQISKDDYVQNYATPQGWHPGMSEAEATVASSKYQHDLYMQSATENHPWATTVGGVAGNLADPLWYVPFADLLKFGVLATRLVDAEKVTKSLFDAGEWGEQAIHGSLQAGLVAGGEEETQDLEGKEPDVTNPLLAMVMGPAVGAISHAIGLPFAYRTAAIQKAAADYAMNDPVDVTAAVRPVVDHNTELEQAIRDPNPDKSIISTFMQSKVSPANARAGRIALDLLDNKPNISQDDLKFFQAWKGGSKSLDDYFDEAIAKAKGEPSEKKITLYNSGTGNQEIWTSDKARAESYAAEGRPIKSKEFNVDEVAAHNTVAGSPAAKAALNAGHQPTSTDYYFGDHPELMKAALESQSKTSEVQILEDAKEGQHLQPANNTPLEDTHETITLESKEPYLEDGKAMDPNQVADAKAAEVTDDVKELYEQLKANQDAEKAAETAKQSGAKPTTEAEPSEPPMELPDYVRRTLDEGNNASANLRSKALGLLRALTCRTS